MIYYFFGLFDNCYQVNIKMDDDIFFIPDTISIMSKLKEPPTISYQEHSLSKIIREQAVNYEEENIQDEWKLKDQRIVEKKISKTDKKECNRIGMCSNPELKPSTLLQWNDKKQIKQELAHQKVQKRKKDSTAEQNNMRSVERRGNLMLFDDDQKQYKITSNSKKEKRTQKIKLDEQKTKKIEFQDIDRYKKQHKKQGLTKIRHNDENYDVIDNNLGLLSKQNSENLMDSRDFGILTHKITSNYSLLMAQVKEQMSVIRYQYIEAQKIEIRKMISKLEGDIRRMKIGFRGSSDSLGKCSNSNVLSPSKLKSQQSRLRIEGTEGNGFRLKRKGEVTTNKIESKIRKDKSPQNYQFFAYDYGMQAQNLFDKEDDQKIKLENLQQQIRTQQTRENKFIFRLNDLQKKYNILRVNNMRKDDSLLRRTQVNHNGGSILKRSNLLKQRIGFLKNQLKQTKLFYSNKIKRLKNQNTILNNQNIYISKEIQQSKIQFRPKKIVTQQQIPKQNLMLFDEVQVERTNYRAYDGQNKVVSTSNKDLTSGIASMNDVRSLQSINSVKSINVFHSKPSIGSINSYKSTKIQSTEKKKSLENHNPIKNKLKMKSPHHLSPPSLGQLKQNSFLKRFNNEERENRALNMSKKSASLDIAIKQLQQKYSKHLQQRFNQDEYYQHYK